MSNIKTVNLSGNEMKVTNLSGQNTTILNLGSAPVYASASARIVPNTDGVAEIPAGGGIILFDTHGTVYLFGEGRVQLTGTNHSTVNFNVPSSSTGGDGSGGGEGGVSKDYVDARDAVTLAAAKKYADEKTVELEPATSTKLGGIMVGDGLEVAADGRLSAPFATEAGISALISDQTASDTDVDELFSSIFDT